MLTNDTIWSEMQTPIDVTQETTTITLQDGISLYKLNVGSTDTEVDFATSTIAPSMISGSYNVIRFEVIVSMGSTVQTIEFPENVTWIDSIPPTMNAANKNYLILFTSYDGGQSWLGAPEGSWNNA